MSSEITFPAPLRPGGLAGADPGAFVDLSLYPLGRLGSPEGARVLAESRRRLFETGVCLLPGFLRVDARAGMAEAARALEGEAWFFRAPRDVCLDAADGARLDGGPGSIPVPSSVGSVPDDRLAPDSLLRRLYEWEPLREFVGAIMGVPCLYRLDDPLGALYINAYREGDHDGWHFDETEYTTLLMLQAPEAGGVHEHVPGLRGNAAVDHDARERIIEGRSNEVASLTYRPGDLVIYSGQRSLHRVTEVRGARSRLVAVLCYETRSGHRNSETVRRMFWGRAN